MCYLQLLENVVGSVKVGGRVLELLSNLRTGHPALDARLTSEMPDSEQTR
jgi:hypothetical protein